MRAILLIIGLLLSGVAVASNMTVESLDLTRHWAGYASIAIFILAYLLVIFEEKLHLRKSKPVMLAAGLIWVLIALVYHQMEVPHAVEAGIQSTFLEYAELFFFLLVAMTYINAMIERGVFTALRDWLVVRGFSYRALFWITGSLSFLISPIADNMTTALIMCAVVLTVGANEPQFVALSCINIVVGANAGGAFSPFGDITTLMVWQKGVVEFWEFFALIVPSLVNFFVPAMVMNFALPSGKPPLAQEAQVGMKYGGLVIVALFLATIATAVNFHIVLDIPAVFGMMLGLGYLKFYGYFLRCKSRVWNSSSENPPGADEDPYDFDVFHKIAQAEWDTLFFFYGVILAVGGLGFIGYLGMMSATLYGELGPTAANVLMGVVSAVVDNIPVMFAVLTMHPDMPHVQWFLVTLTTGVGGSMLSIGSAAGVALMGQARGQYTFFTHLKWTPVIALGYAASIWLHLVVNG